jgi:hypothetical protein
MKVLKKYWTIRDNETGQRYKLRDWDFNRKHPAEIFPLFSDESVAKQWCKIEAGELDLQLEVIPFVHEVENEGGLFE